MRSQPYGYEQDMSFNFNFGDENDARASEKQQQVSPLEEDITVNDYKYGDYDKFKDIFFSSFYINFVMTKIFLIKNSYCMNLQNFIHMANIRFSHSSSPNSIV